MVQGLAFLSKKSWHVKNIANQEKVWIAEQREQQEKQKAQELAKQIQQEREQEELDRIAGKSSTKDRGIDWMYQGHLPESDLAKEDAAKQAEEYLLGKEFTPAAAAGAKGDLAAAADESTQNGGGGGLQAVVKAAATAEEEEEPDKKPPAHSEPTVAERNEAFRMRLEDPMYAITHEEMQKRRDLEKKKELFEKVTGKTAVSIHHQQAGDDDVGEKDDERRRRRKQEKRERKRDSKRRKKERKSRRKRKHRRRDRHHSEGDDDESSSDDDRSLEPNRARASREYSPEEHPRRADGRRKRSRSPEEDRRRGERHQRKRSRSWSQERESSQRRDRSRRDDRYGREEDRYSERGHRRQVDEERSHAKKPPPAPSKQPGFGLQGVAADNHSNNSQDLGPNKELLRRKRAAREAERQQHLERGSKRSAMTEQERADALATMESNAQQRFHEKRAERKRDDHHGEQRRGTAAFLGDVTRQVHGIS